MKEIVADTAYELAKSFATSIQNEFLSKHTNEVIARSRELTNSEFESSLTHIHEEHHCTPRTISYTQLCRTAEIKDSSDFIQLLKDTRVDVGWWIGDYTGHSGEFMLSLQDTREQAEAWIAEMKDNPYCTYLEIYEVRIE